MPWIHNDIIYIHHIRHTSQRQGLVSLNSKTNVFYIQICHSLSSWSWAILWEYGYLTYRLCACVCVRAHVCLQVLSLMLVRVWLFIKECICTEPCMRVSLWAVSNCTHTKNADAFWSQNGAIKYPQRGVNHAMSTRIYPDLNGLAQKKKMWGEDLSILHYHGWI